MGDWNAVLYDNKHDFLFYVVFNLMKQKSAFVTEMKQYVNNVTIAITCIF